MKRILLTLLFMLTLAILAGYTTVSYTTTFTDPARDNRQIQTVIYYPEEITGSGETFPYIVFGHGWLMNHTFYSTLTDAMIDLGWIVAFPRTEESMFPSHIEFARDLSFLCGAVFTENANPASPLFGYLSDLSVVMGHSMGGGAAVLAAGMDNDFASLVTFCAAETDVSAIGGAVDVLIPSITLSGSADTIAPSGQHQLPIYTNLASDYKSYISITGAGHLNLYNNALISPLLTPWFAYLKTGEYSHIQAFEAVLEQNSTSLTYQIVDNLVVSNHDSSNSPNFCSLASYPNPFYQHTTVSFEVKKSVRIRADIYNCKGQKVRTLLDGFYPKGSHSAVWDGRDDHNSPVADGVYYLRLQSPQGHTLRKVLLLK